MSYENAPATQMLATHCACCGKPLLDAVSVETGVGPDCRRRHGYANPNVVVGLDLVCAVAANLATTPVGAAAMERAGKADDGAARAVANLLVHAIAVAQTGEHAAAYAAALRDLGWVKLAERVCKRLGGDVTVETNVNGDLEVTSPYSPAFVDNIHRACPSRWDRAREVRVVAARYRRELWCALVASYPLGTMIRSGERVTVLTADVVERAFASRRVAA